MKGFKLDLMTALSVIVIVGVILTVTVQASSGPERRSGSIAAVQAEIQQSVARVSEK